ncbi:MAG: MOSC domain-containing protein [Hamadaea sp.]|uniref:MOSC domain-containing protein n=1 Tax=Hamadaea sp. TaxID=2024425 RepID=UPI00181AE37E|nr:MOSC N-terminal beta barrel domain-containing protein [Hamadaea sp.]NUR74203.1 MOSC domain-containing protein [Hamadaea sp.]NUT22287.1 MOSC domain-containing protein [Hamadaea sp.]
MRLASIHLYPVKSLGGVTVDEAAVEPWGLRHDRRWLVLHPDGSYLTARDEHRMLGVTAVPAAGSLTLTGLDGSRLTVAEPVDGDLVPTEVSRLEQIRLAPAEAHEWLSVQFGRSLRLAWLDDPRRRSVGLDHGGQPGDPLNLSDAGPLLAATTASMRRLNDWIADGAAERGEKLPEPLPVSRFRPNLVFDGVTEPFAEDGWQRVRVGSVDFRFAEVCDRCVLTTIDAATFRTGKEPIRTLSRFRKWDGKTWFGVRLIPLRDGVIRVGDDLTVS